VKLVDCALSELDRALLIVGSAPQRVEAAGQQVGKADKAVPASRFECQRLLSQIHGRVQVVGALALSR